MMWSRIFHKIHHMSHESTGFTKHNNYKDIKISQQPLSFLLSGAYFVKNHRGK